MPRVRGGEQGSRTPDGVSAAGSSARTDGGVARVAQPARYARTKESYAPDKALRGWRFADFSSASRCLFFHQATKGQLYITVNLLICMRTNASVVELLNHGLYVKDVVVPVVVAPPEEE